MMSIPGALFVVAGRPYVDSQTLHNLAQTYSVSPVEDGWKVMGPDGEAILCLGTTCPPLPGQRGSLYEARAVRGAKVADACALWLARGAARLAGKHAAWPTAEGCGCGVSCGCGPCQSRHHAGTMSALSAEEAGVVASVEPQHVATRVNDEVAAQYVLDAAPLARGYVPETEKREPSGFFLHLYLVNGEDEEKAVTFEVESPSSLRITWFVQPTSATRRSEIVRAVDLLIQEAYDEENHRDPS